MALKVPMAQELGPLHWILTAAVTAEASTETVPSHALLAHVMLNPPVTPLFVTPVTTPVSIWMFEHVSILQLSPYCPIVVPVDVICMPSQASKFLVVF
jgi:hypothetical protein